MLPELTNVGRVFLKMKKVLLLIGMILLFSCEKPKESTDQCWTCIDKYGIQPVFREWETCDILEVTSQNGQRWVDKWGKWHFITCKAKD